MSLSAIERLQLAKRSTEIQRQITTATLTAIARLQLAKEKINIRKQLGFSQSPAGEPPASNEPALPELVRKLRDGELVHDEVNTVIEAVTEAKELVPLDACIERVTEWCKENPAAVTL